MKTEEEIPQFLENATVFTCHKSDSEAIKAFIDAPRLDADVLRKLKQERREIEELDMLERVRKIIERNLLVERERDEARTALRELWCSADAFLPNFDAETLARWRKAAGWEGRNERENS